MRTQGPGWGLNKGRRPTWACVPGLEGRRDPRRGSRLWLRGGGRRNWPLGPDRQRVGAAGDAGGWDRRVRADDARRGRAGCCASGGAGLGAWALGTGHGPSWAGALRWGRGERAAGEREGDLGRAGPAWERGLGWVGSWVLLGFLLFLILNFSIPNSNKV